MIGELYVEKGQYSEALKYTKEYRRRSLQLQDPVLEQRALANLGWIYYTMSVSGKEMFGKALQCYTMCVCIFLVNKQ